MYGVTWSQAYSQVAPCAVHWCAGASCVAVVSAWSCCVPATPVGASLNGGPALMSVLVHASFAAGLLRGGAWDRSVVAFATVMRWPSSASGIG